MPPTPPTAPPVSDREILTSRILAAPRERVWLAWTDPRHLAAWWGPAGFTNTFDEHDLRPGGHWRYVMHGPDGTDYRNHCIYAEIDEPARLVFDHVSGPVFRVAATFESVAGGTRVSFRQTFETDDVCFRVRRFAVDANEQNLDRLAAELASMAGERPRPGASEIR